MNGKGRSIDSIAMVLASLRNSASLHERFFRTLKHSNIYINDYQTIKELRGGIKNYIHKYNFLRFHSSIQYQKPMMERSGIPERSEDHVYLEYVQQVA